MAFGHPHKEDKLNIDYSRCTAVNVIAVTNQERKIKPLYFTAPGPYGELCKVKVEAIKYTKQCNGYTSFCCTYQVGSRQRECVLTYYVMDHLWVLEK